MNIGTGSTVAGLALGFLKLANASVRVHGITVCNDAAYFYRVINNLYKELGVTERAEEIVSMVDGYKGIGYDKTSPSELVLMKEIASQTGVILDPTYTLKSVRAILDHKMFHNKKVLFIHTGGLFSIYSKIDLFPKDLFDPIQLLIIIIIIR